jgi:hypothetical protein
MLRSEDGADVQHRLFKQIENVPAVPINRSLIAQHAQSFASKPGKGLACEDVKAG